MASWNNTYVDGKFTHVVDLKNGFLVSDCRDALKCKFLLLIIHPNKPTRVIIIVGNTIFGALEGDCSMDWGLVFRDLA